MKYEYNGVINMHLAERRGLTQEEINILLDLHQLKNEIYANIDCTNDRKELRDLGYALEGVEFGMQRAWRFEENSAMHTHYFHYKCECPRIDNEEVRGIYRIINVECPLHGGRHEE